MKKLFPLLLTTLLLSACSHKATNTIEGRWNIQEYANVYVSSLQLWEVKDGDKYTMQFHDTGLFSCTTDCNTISGLYATNGLDITFKDVGATEIACDNESVERSMKINIAAAEKFEMPSDSTLWLYDRNGNVIVKLVKLTNWER